VSFAISVMNLLLLLWRIDPFAGSDPR
jgi:hypothetical protein